MHPGRAALRYAVRAHSVSCLLPWHPVPLLLLPPTSRPCCCCGHRHTNMPAPPLQTQGAPTNTAYSCDAPPWSLHPAAAISAAVRVAVPVSPPACAGVEQVHQLIRLHVQQLVQVHATECELAAVQHNNNDAGRSSRWERKDIRRMCQL